MKNIEELGQPDQANVAVGEPGARNGAVPGDGGEEPSQELLLSTADGAAAEDESQDDIIDEEIDLESEDWFGSIEVDESVAFTTHRPSSPPPPPSPARSA